MNESEAFVVRGSGLCAMSCHVINQSLLYQQHH
eukprot:COSAG06_NODE_8989_length_2017_cov_1476.919708_2_plen_33_part_00